MNVMTNSSKVDNIPFPLAASLDEASARAAVPAFRLDLLGSLMMHPVLAFSITIGSLVLLLLYGLTIKPTYEAEAVVHVQPDSFTLLDEASKPSFDPGRYDSFLQEQILSMQRSDTISAALGRLPRHVWAEYGSSEEEATQQILAKIKIARVGTSYQVSLMLKGSDPRNVTNVMNAITYAYLDLVHKENNIDNDERVGLLTQERQRVVNELRRDQEEQSALGASLGSANPDGEGDPYEGELTALREQLVQAQSAHAAAAARMASLTGRTQGNNSVLAAEADEAILSDAGLSALKSSTSERRTTLRGQMSGMTPDNPLRRRDQEELIELEHSLEEMTAKLHVKSERELQEKLRADLQRTGDLEARIHSQLARRTATATSATPKLQRAAELSGDIKRLLLRQSEIENTTRHLQLDANSPGAVRLTLAAQVPTSPERNRKQTFVMASFPLALMLGAAAAAVSRKRDPRLYTRLDVSALLGFAPLVTLPAPNEVSEAAFAKEVLRLTGAITSAYRAKGVHAFLFTPVSAPTDIEPLSRMLIEKLRETGISACSVSSADLLLPVYTDQMTDSECLFPTGNNSFPPVQTGHRGFADLKLASLKERHSVVVVKASQPFECAETEYIARCADATIFVVQSAITTRAELLQAAESAQRLNVPTAGVVLLEVKKRYIARSMHEAVDAFSTSKHLARVLLQEQAPLPNDCEAMASVYSESEASLSAQPKRFEATQAVDVQSIDSSTSVSDVSTQRKLGFRMSPPSLSQIHLSEDRPASCQSAPEAEALIVFTDETVCGNETAHSSAVAGQAIDLARIEEVSCPAASAYLLGVSTEKDFPSQVSDQSTQQAVPKAVVPGPQIDADVVGLLNRSAEQRIQEQPKQQKAGYAMPSEVVRPVMSTSSEKICGKRTFVLKEGYADSSSSVHSAKWEEPDLPVQSSTFQAYDLEKALSSSQADQDSMLSRQWTLLSRFQQERKALSTI